MAHTAPKNQGGSCRRAAPVFQKKVEAYHMTPIKSIRAHCIDCCGGSRKEVQLCPAEKCALHPYRMGRRPKAATEDPAALEDSADITDE